MLFSGGTIPQNNSASVVTAVRRTPRVARSTDHTARKALNQTPGQGIARRRRGTSRSHESYMPETPVKSAPWKLLQGWQIWEA